MSETKMAAGPPDPPVRPCLLLQPAHPPWALRPMPLALGTAGRGSLRGRGQCQHGPELMLGRLCL